MELPVAACWHCPPVSLFMLGEEDVGPAYVAWLNDGEVNRSLESRFVTHDEEGTRAFVATMRARADTLFLGVRDERLDRHVGNIKLGPIDPHHGVGEVGLMIGDRAAWGHGIGTAAIAAIADIARAQLSLRKLSAGCYAGNIGSRKAFEKAGFRVEGVRPAHFMLDGRPEDLILLGLIL